MAHYNYGNDLGTLSVVPRIFMITFHLLLALAMLSLPLLLMISLIKRGGI